MNAVCHQMCVPMEFVNAHRMSAHFKRVYKKMLSNSEYKPSYSENMDHNQKNQCLIDHLNSYVWMHNTQKSRLLLNNRDNYTYLWAV